MVYTTKGCFLGFQFSQEVVQKGCHLYVHGTTLLQVGVNGNTLANLF
jgi:hypothetical protein